MSKPASEMWIGVDGAVERASQVLVGAMEGGASVGWGVFTTGAIVGGRPTLLARHMARLRDNALRSRLVEEPLEESWEAGWSDTLGRVIRANGIERGMFRLTLCARGEGRWAPRGEPRALVAAVPSDLEAVPVRAWLSPYHLDARRPGRGVKSTSYAPWHLMSLEAGERGCGEALYRDSGGFLCEGARSSLFWKRGSEVFTPGIETGCLPGIARAVLLSWLSEPGSPWKARQAQAASRELEEADEIFLCSATLGPRAVTRLQCDEGGVLWRGEVGPACWSLGLRWRELLEAGG